MERGPPRRATGSGAAGIPSITSLIDLRVLVSCAAAHYLAGVSFS